MSSTLTPALIVATTSDDELFKLIGEELERLLPIPRQPTDQFVAQLRRLPRGLRAMAATYELDVSLTLDDLGWHFGNWHHVGLAEETARGLRELGADELAEVFEKAFVLARQYWRDLGDSDWPDWYRDSPLDRALDPLNEKAWEILDTKKKGIFSYWVEYARRFPERLRPE